MVYPLICMRMFIWGVAHMVDPWVCMRMFMCVWGVACVHISSCIWGHEVNVGSHCLPYIFRSLTEPELYLSLLPHNQDYRSAPLDQPLMFFKLNLLVCIHAHATVRV